MVIVYRPTTIPDEKPVLQIILSPTCPHCRVAYNDIFDNLDILSDEYYLNVVYVGNINAQEMNIKGVPTFILYKNGIETTRVVGFSDTTTLITQLERHGVTN